MWTALNGSDQFYEFTTENKRIDIAVRGVWQGEIVIQRKFYDNTNLPSNYLWGTIDTTTENMETYDVIPRPDHSYRIGFLATKHISGTAYIGMERSYT